MSLRPMDSEYKRVLSPSLSLITIASLTPKKHKVYIEDQNVDKADYEDEPDLVGITVNVDTAKRAYKIAAKYRERGIPVIFGGIHVSANPKEASKHADSICIGEAEEIWEGILEDLENKKLKKKYFNTKATDLANYPQPRWELIDKKKYLYCNIIYSSRGCPFKCEFCYNSNEYVYNKYRNRPIAEVIKEIKNMDTKQVMFIDDNFIGNIPWAKDLVKQMTPLGLTWHAAVSTNIVHNLDLLDAMAESGCKSLFLGFESINPESIKSVQKHQNNIEKYDQLIEELHKRDIMINASIVFGFDHDTKTVFKDTVDWLVKNKIETMTAHILTPYPGTKLHKRLENEGRITDKDTNKYNTANVVFQPVKMTQNELYDGYIWAYKEFYSFKNIWKRLPTRKRRRLPYLMFNLCYRKFGKVTSLLGRIGLMNFLGRLGRRLSYNIN